MVMARIFVYLVLWFMVCAGCCSRCLVPLYISWIMSVNLYCLSQRCVLPERIWVCSCQVTGSTLGGTFNWITGFGFLDHLVIANLTVKQHEGWLLVQFLHIVAKIENHIFSMHSSWGRGCYFCFAHRKGTSFRVQPFAEARLLLHRPS